MTALLIILASLLGLILLLALSLLLFRIVLRIDTDEGIFRISQGPLYRCALFEDADQPMVLKCRILFVPFSIDLMKVGKRRKTHRPKREKKRKEGRKGKKRGRISFRKVIQVLRTFKIREFILRMDTGDVVFNAQLYPVAAIINATTPRSIYINVNPLGDNSLKLKITNRPVNVLRALLFKN